MPLQLKQGLAPYWFKPAEYKDDENGPAFKLRPLSQMEVVRAMQGAFFSGDDLHLTADGIKAALELGVTDWQNIELDGKPAKFNRLNMQKVPFDILKEVAFQLVKDATLEAEEAKN